jgi:hypothetical protein
MSTAAPTPAKPDQPASHLLWLIAGAGVALLLVLLGVVLTRRRDEQLSTTYGRRRGTEVASSVNGTAVLADLYRRQGRRVGTVVRFSPALDRYQTVIWAPDDFAPPDKTHRDYLETWLTNGSGRTVVYIGRDYDAAVDYWQRIAADAPPEQADEVVRRQAEARARFEAERSAMPIKEDAQWFAVSRDDPPQAIESLSGPWAEGIDAKETALHLEGRLSIPASPAEEMEFETLLEADGEPLVTRVTNSNWGDGQIIVVANGSWGLNYPLVNHQNRKLAAKLIEASSAKDDRVVFVESTAGGPLIRDKEKPSSPPNSLELLKVWPLNAILLHVAMLGIVLCLARAPIFGRPRELPGDSRADFGKHVAALGKLLAATKDQNYAHARLLQYRQVADRRKTPANKVTPNKPTAKK